VQNNFYYTGQFANIYKKSSKFSEVTSQILYGEKFKILSKNKSWIKIKSSYDNYIGYIKNNKYKSKLKLTHKIFRLKANIFSKPNRKTKNFLTFGSDAAFEAFKYINKGLASGLYEPSITVFNEGKINLPSLF